MMAAISLDLRVRIFDARQAGDDTAEVAERFAVSPAFVRRLVQRHRETGSLAPRRTRPGPRPRLTDLAEPLRDLLARHPDLTAAEARDRLGASVSRVTVWRAVRRLGLTFKKRRSGRPSKTGLTSGRPVTRGRRPSSPPRPSG